MWLQFQIHIKKTQVIQIQSHILHHALPYAQLSTTTCGKMVQNISKQAIGQDILNVAFVRILVLLAQNVGLVTEIASNNPIVQSKVTRLRLRN
jgi:hypothetical protein